MNNSSTEKKHKYKQDYNGRDNTEYQPEAKEPVHTFYERVFNAATEKYEYKEVTINYKEDWDNTERDLESQREE